MSVYENIFWIGWDIENIQPNKGCPIIQFITLVVKYFRCFGKISNFHISMSTNNKLNPHDVELAVNYFSIYKQLKFNIVNSNNKNAADMNIIENICKWIYNNKYDNNSKFIILISNDGDFSNIIRIAKKNNIRCIILHSNNCSNNLISVAHYSFHVDIITKNIHNNSLQFLNISISAAFLLLELTMLNFNCL